LRAVVLRDGTLQVREAPDPTPGPGELLLRTLSTAICASDVHFMDHPELAVDDPTGRSLYDPRRDLVLGHEFGGEVVGHGPGPHPQDWYGTLDAIAAGRLDPLPSVGRIIGLDEVPDALELARRSDGPPRIVVHPNGEVA
jgi:threonine dehydrogenase-like Zn-dependent dehydrogenase